MPVIEYCLRCAEPTFPVTASPQCRPMPIRVGGMARAADSASTRAYKAANDRMHRDMSIRFTGDADRDFVAGMIAHHQGAIDMAEAELEYGKDDWARAMAQNVITLIGVAGLFAKIFAFIFFFMWVRWTIPRFRYDQLMNLGWKILLPISIINVLLTAVVILWRNGLLHF